MGKTILKVFSILCSIFSYIVGILVLYWGVSSIGAPGFDSLGTIFIFPALMVMAVVTTDFLVTINAIKNGLGYSIAISVLKLCFIGLFIYLAIDEYKRHTMSYASNFQLYIWLLVVFTILLIPSLINMIDRLNKRNNTII